MVVGLALPEFVSSRRSVVAGAGGQSDDVEDVELEEDGDGEKDGVDHEARHAQGPGQDESGGRETTFSSSESTESVNTFRVTLVVAHLGWDDYHFGHSTVSPFLPG